MHGADMLQSTAHVRLSLWLSQVDGKVTDMQAFKSRTTHVICGPTDDDQPAFRCVWGRGPMMC